MMFGRYKMLEKCRQAILANPEADKPRLAYAKLIRKTEPERAEFIKRQIEYWRLVRKTKDHPPGGRFRDVSYEESELLKNNDLKWSLQDLGPYMGTLGIHSNVEFQRGFPWLCSMDPLTFLEHGQHVFENVAPLRGIEFFWNRRGEPFPAKQLAESPLLEHLVELRFCEGTLGENDLEIIAQSPHLSRVLAIDVRRNQMTLAAWEALAANPLTRKCLYVDSLYRVPSDDGLIGECTARFDVYRPKDFEMSQEGRELERKYGYIPWLHWGHGCSPHYATAWVEDKVLPLFVPGSPADAPIPYGCGIWEQYPRLPRSQFDERSYDSVS